MGTPKKMPIFNDFAYGEYMATPATFAVSVNGVPLATVIDREVRDEINHQRAVEVGTIGRSVRSHIITRRMRNSSGSRSGRGRVIFTAVANA